jgi:hypothetical protein
MGYSSTTDFQGSSGRIPARGISENSYEIGMRNSAGASTDRTACGIDGCRHREILRRTLAEAIEAIEATRSAFKSKQLEVLRKKLIKVLVEEC